MLHTQSCVKQVNSDPCLMIIEYEIVLRLKTCDFSLWVAGKEFMENVKMSRYGDTL